MYKDCFKAAPRDSILPNQKEDFMRALSVFLLVTVLLTTGCVKNLQPVATLEELDSTEELGKERNWFKQSHARFHAGFVAGSTLVLLPVALVVANIPNETHMTVAEVADVAAAKTYDYDSTLYLEWIAYTDGAWSPDFWIIGRGKGQKDSSGIKPVGVIYRNSKDDKVYLETWVLQKKDKDYWAWRVPLLKKKGNDLVYALDERLRLKKARQIGAYNLMNLVLENTENNTEVEKSESDILPEVKELYIRTGQPMQKLRYANGSTDKEQGTEQFRADQKEVAAAPL